MWVLVITGMLQIPFDSGEGFFFISGQFFWDVLASRQPKVYPEKAEGLVEVTIYHL